MAPPDQEPRTGGVARELIAYPLAVALDGVSMPDHKFNAAVAAVQKLIASHAESLIDPNDPAVEDAICQSTHALLPDLDLHDRVISAVLAALRGAK
jgi:hypothetical protein